MNRSFSLETSSLLTTAGHLLLLNLDGNNITIMREKCNLDGSSECKTKRIEKMSDRTSIRVSSTHTIAAWLKCRSGN